MLSSVIVGFKSISCNLYVINKLVPLKINILWCRCASIWFGRFPFSRYQNLLFQIKYHAGYFRFKWQLVNFARRDEHLWPISYSKHVLWDKKLVSAQLAGSYTPSDEDKKALCVQGASICYLLTNRVIGGDDKIMIRAKLHIRAFKNNENKKENTQAGSQLRPRPIMVASRICVLTKQNMAARN